MAAGMVIAGAGVCGASAALALREAGYDGPITLVGGEPHVPYERPPLSKSAITDEGPPCLRAFVTDEQLAQASIAFVRANPAVRIDPDAASLVLAGGTAIPYAKLLLATGATPRRLAGTSSRLHYLRSFEDALDLRSSLATSRRVVVIGGGFIGLELAASARMVGAEVTVVEPRTRLLMRGVPAEIAEILQQRHCERGVRVLCNQEVARIDEDERTLRIATSGGEVLTADLCIVGIGATPETGLAETAGLAVDNGIVVDAGFRTTRPDIFAAGDCASVPLDLYGSRRVRLESWRSAREQGVLAARSMLGGPVANNIVPWFWSDQYDLTLFVAGLPDAGSVTVRHDLGNGAFLLFHLTDDGRLVAASGIGPGNAVARDVRLAEMLIARRAHPSPERLMAVDCRLKSLLAA